MIIMVIKWFKTIIMGYTYMYNIITICSKSGCVIDRLNNEDASNHKWKKGYIQMRDLGIMKTYNIYISEKAKDSGYYMLLRPRKKYQCCNFQILFNFKHNCIDYTDNRILGIVNKPT